jgi:hypothetical protein
MIVGLGSVAVCPSCKRGVQVLGVRQDVRSGQPAHFDINIILLPGTAEKDAKPS